MRLQWNATSIPSCFVFCANSQPFRRFQKFLLCQDTLHAVQSVDGRAARIAATMQNELTDKRALIDSLKSELAKVCER